ncbi:hypothetical protein [Clostridium estertheticum]|uniref:Uncharacterized protein n=1 Tax=Clostridium estertheticum TaxID=238834 RepID=A0A7Y3WUR1_9CLOT|nr:hypothetical protein [Clostridium estertheticum]MBW9173373.1 hypothetical protein [Clostridium estertheticum]NNU78358.1 hypothetical protein [Clostridium estertheticum]WBL45288.1 hypothetical protein LOR37_11290 [Clostridium estertheticum]WLC73369.1 hypothetical protein KTC99_11115 [Clostridium estertheticum]
MKDRHRHLYVIHELTETKFELCRVLNTYDTDSAAIDDVKKLLSNKISEKDLLKMLDKKGIC